MRVFVCVSLHMERKKNFRFGREIKKTNEKRLRWNFSGLDGPNLGTSPKAKSLTYGPDNGKKKLINVNVIILVLPIMYSEQKQYRMDEEEKKLKWLLTRKIRRIKLVNDKSKTSFSIV